MSALQVLTSTGTDSWRTPRIVLDVLDAHFLFGLDAAACSGHEAFPGRPYLGPGSPWGEDALDGQPWPGTGAVWLNPPYSRAGGRGEGILAWHRAAATTSREQRRTVVVLCPPHPGRRWFWEQAATADEVWVYRQRIAFINEEGIPVRGNSQDSCLVIYRPGPRQMYTSPKWSWINVPREAR
jgi:phage N-6-adenine-methyltransferase